MDNIELPEIGTRRAFLMTTTPWYNDMHKTNVRWGYGAPKGLNIWVQHIMDEDKFHGPFHYLQTDSEFAPSRAGAIIVAELINTNAYEYLWQEVEDEN